VPEPPPAPSAGHAASRQSGSQPAAAIDLGSWKQAFSKFGSNADQHLPARNRSQVEESAADSGAPVAVLEQLRMEWGRFLEHLSAKGLQVLVSHLHASELMSCSPSGLVQLGCCRKFSYEELQHDSTLLESELADFYKLPLKLAVRYDAERDACTREKSIFTMFQELTESNEVFRYLITEFGAELAY
jgi:DNA polymerase III subunit gamma/tau